MSVIAVFIEFTYWKCKITKITSHFKQLDNTLRNIYWKPVYILKSLVVITRNRVIALARSADVYCPAVIAAAAATNHLPSHHPLGEYQQVKMLVYRKKVNLIVNWMLGKFCLLMYNCYAVRWDCHFSCSPSGEWQEMRRYMQKDIILHIRRFHNLQSSVTHISLRRKMMKTVQYMFSSNAARDDGRDMYWFLA